MKICAVDTCVLMRLAAGLPEGQYEQTLAAIGTLLTNHPGLRIVAHNIAIGESYISLQRFYGFTKAESRTYLAGVLTSGLVEPLDGERALDAIQAASGGAGLIDRLLVLDAEVRGTIPLYTLDRALAKVTNVTLLFAPAKA